MSKQISEPMSYKCSSDCRQEGCPGHTVEVIYENTSDTVAILKDEEVVAIFDDNQWEAIKKAEETIK